MNQSVVEEVVFDERITYYGKVASNVAFGTAAIIGIPGNILVLFAIIYSRDMRTLSNIFIFNLALADLFLLLGTPILIVQSVKNEWVFGPIICKLYLTSSGVNQFASATFMAVLSFDRYLAVCHAVKSTRWRTRTTALFLVLFAWIIVLFEIIPIVKFSRMITRISNDSTVTESCTLYWGDMNKFDQLFPVSRRLFTIYSFTLSYVLPLTAVWFFYAKIILRVWLRRSTFWAHRHRLRRTTTKVTVMGLAIVISYTLFYLPFWAVQWSIELNLSWIHNRNWLIPLSYFAYALLYINSALNPFLCVFFTDTFIQKVFRRQKDPYPALHKRSAFETAVYAPVQNPQTGRPPLVHAPRQDVVL